VRPAQRSRLEIDRLLAAAGWAVQESRQTSTLREVVLGAGRGFAVPAEQVVGKARRAIKAKKRDAALTGVEIQLRAGQHRIVAVVDRCLSIVREVQA
jgi:hypothetical protein